VGTFSVDPPSVNPLVDRSRVIPCGQHSWNYLRYHLRMHPVVTTSVEPAGRTTSGFKLRGTARGTHLASPLLGPTSGVSSRGTHLGETRTGLPCSEDPARGPLAGTPFGGATWAIPLGDTTWAKSFGRHPGGTQLGDYVSGTFRTSPLKELTSGPTSGHTWGTPFGDPSGDPLRGPTRDPFAGPH
jgi:hypothetical protein